MDGNGAVDMLLVRKVPSILFANSICQSAVFSGVESGRCSHCLLIVSSGGLVVCCMFACGNPQAFPLTLRLQTRTKLQLCSGSA